MPREKENMELTDTKAKRRRENNECGEKCTREDGRRDSKTEWCKKTKKKNRRKPIVAYFFATEKERRCANLMEKEEDGGPRELRTEERRQTQKRIIIRERSRENYV